MANPYEKPRDEHEQTMTTCPSCHGSGKDKQGKECKPCHGKGKVPARLFGGIGRFFRRLLGG